MFFKFEKWCGYRLCSSYVICNFLLITLLYHTIFKVFSIYTLTPQSLIYLSQCKSTLLRSQPCSEQSPITRGISHWLNKSEIIQSSTFLRFSIFQYSTDAFCFLFLWYLNNSVFSRKNEFVCFHSAFRYDKTKNHKLH